MIILAIESSCDETGVGIARLDDDGTVTLWGTPVSHFDARSARGHGVALVQQHFTLVPAMTVAEPSFSTRTRISSVGRPPAPSMK